jgi:hypothetical protein
MGNRANAYRFLDALLASKDIGDVIMRSAGYGSTFIRTGATLTELGRQPVAADGDLCLRRHTRVARFCRRVRFLAEVETNKRVIFSGLEFGKRNRKPTLRQNRNCRSTDGRRP